MDFEYFQSPGCLTAHQQLQAAAQPPATSLLLPKPSFEEECLLAPGATSPAFAALLHLHCSGPGIKTLMYHKRQHTQHLGESCLEAQSNGTSGCNPSSLAALQCLVLHVKSRTFSAANFFHRHHVSPTYCRHIQKGTGKGHGRATIL